LPAIRYSRVEFPYEAGERRHLLVKRVEAMAFGRRMRVEPRQGRKAAAVGFAIRVFGKSGAERETKAGGGLKSRMGVHST